MGKINGSRPLKLTSLSQKAGKKVEVKNNANDKDAEVLIECMKPSILLANAATNATGAKKIHIGNISIDYPVPDKEDRFNIRQYFSRLMQELLKLGCDMIVGSITNEENDWTTTRDLPTGDAFNKAFSVKLETQNDKLHVIMHGTIKFTWKWKDLKGVNEYRAVEEGKAANPVLTEGDRNLVPKLDLFTWNYKFEDAQDRVEA
eukprot:227578-Ditylum_brightwellii.AAC.1